MKGFVRTLEATIGTILIIGLIGSVATLTQGDSNNLVLKNVNSQLDDLEERGVLQEIIRNRNTSRLESELDTAFYQSRAVIKVDDVNQSSSTQTSFSKDFNYTANNSAANLYLYGTGQQVDVTLNGNTVFTGTVNAETVDMTSEVVDGSNTLSFDNPSGNRLSYVLALEESFGGTAPSSEEVFVVKRVLTTSGDFKTTEVYVYLWR